MTADLIVLAVFALVAASACLRLRADVVLAVALALDVLQVFVTDAFALSLATVWQLAALVVVVRERRMLPRLPLVLALFGLYLVLSVAALVWSPDRQAGLALCAQLVGLGSTAALAIVVVRRRRLTMPLVVFSALLGVSAVSILLFRFVPSVEDQYFHSPLFGLLNGHGLAENFFTSDRNNVLDKVKAGGLFFVNANAASLFSGAGGALAASLAVRLRGLGRAALGTVVALDLAAVLATGSKSGLYLAGLAIATLATVLVVRSRRRALIPVAALLGTSLAIAGLVLVAAPALVRAATPVPPVAAPGVPSQATGTAADTTPPATSAASSGEPDLAVRSMDSIGTRFDIWRIGVELAEQRPYGAFGFGGWARHYGPLAPAAELNPGFPPHDWPLQVWSDTGALSLLVVGALLAVITVRAFRRGPEGDAVAPADRVLAAVALGWVLLHGLADNTGAYGGPRLLVVTAVAVAVLLLSGQPSVGVVPQVRRRSERDAQAAAPAILLTD